MKTILGLVLLLLLALGGYFLWAGRHVPVTGVVTGQAANQDARALSSTEQAVFLPMVCGGASAGSGGYAHNCTSLPGYPSDDYGGDGLGLGITLTSVIYGHITDAATAQAYVNYQGSFEPHVNNFGGGILFNQTATGWALAGWYPGGALEGCLALNPQGRSKMLCVAGSTGQGETDTGLYVATVPPPAGSGAQPDLTPVLKASDLRETLNPEANCGLRKSAGQDVLLSIDSAARAGSGYTAQVEYVPAAVAEAACKVKKFASAPVQKSALALSWDGSAITIAPGFNFAPSS